MRRGGTADVPLHNGRVPAWLAERMTRLGGAISEAVVAEFGRTELLSRLSDPFWFQALGAVMGMDWHSSGITTSVLGALKRGLKGTGMKGRAAAGYLAEVLEELEKEGKIEADSGKKRYRMKME